MENTASPQELKWSTSKESDLFGNQAQPEQPASLSLGNVDLSMLADLGNQIVEVALQQEEALTITTDVIEVVDQEQELRNERSRFDPNYDEALDDPALDEKGSDRQWNNQPNETFTPTAGVPANEDDEKLVCCSPAGGEGAATNHFTGASAKFDAYLRDYESSGQVYRDQEFPTNMSSMAGFSEGPRRNQYQKYVWRRLRECYPNRQVSVINGRACINDIMQGALGDCYLLAAISALAEYPERMQKCILSKTINNAGIYCVQICVTGIWEDVIIDDEFPIVMGEDKSAFAYSKNGSTWVMFLEKAYAKVYGGFDNIAGGVVDNALFDLTGAPTKFFMSKELSAEAHWRQLIEADRNRFVMGAHTRNFTGQSNDAQDKSSGIANTHAYTVIGAYEIVNEYGRKRVLRSGEPSSPYNDRIVKLRNPWGRGEWLHEWSDNSSNWTAELKQELLPQGSGEDGIFFMPLDKFLHYFDCYIINYFRDDYKHSGQKYYSSPEEVCLINFSVQTPGKYYLTVSQKDRRAFRKSDNYTYSQLALELVKSEGGRIIPLANGSSLERDFFISADLGPGDYVAQVSTPWRRNVNEFGLSVYGPQEVELTTGKAADFKGGNPTEMSAMQAAKANLAGRKNFQPYGYADVSYVTGTAPNGANYYYFKNENSGAQLTAVVDFTGSSGVNVLPPYSGSRVSVIVGPGEEKIMLYKTEPRARVSYRMSATFKPGCANIASQVAQQGKKMPRPDSYGQDVGISLTVLRHSNGMTATYENLSSSHRLEETVEFNLVDARIEGMYGSAIHIRLEPNYKSVISIIKTGPNYSANVASCQYNISPVW